MRLEIADATAYLRQLVREHMLLDTLSPRNVITVVREFAAQEFVTAKGFESDGFLFEYGPDPVHGERYVVRFARQLERPSSADFGGYFQVCIDILLEIAENAGDFTPTVMWWFSTDSRDIHDWLAQVECSPIWEHLNQHATGEVTVYGEDV